MKKPTEIHWIIVEKDNGAALTKTLSRTRQGAWERFGTVAFSGLLGRNYFQAVKVKLVRVDSPKGAK